MKRSILAASVAVAALMASSGTALADATAFAGHYVGVDIGYGFGEANSERFGATAAYGSTQLDADLNGVSFGAHAGHNMLLGTMWIIGVEAGVNYSGLEGDDNGNGGDNNEFTADWEASLRAHVGFSINNHTMLYALGGYSWLGGDSNVTDPGELESVSETYSGWTLGGGVEVTLAPNLRGRLQYRHTNYDAENLVFPINGYNMETGPAVDEVSLGVSFAM